MSAAVDNLAHGGGAGQWRGVGGGERNRKEGSLNYTFQMFALWFLSLKALSAIGTLISSSSLLCGKEPRAYLKLWPAIARSRHLKDMKQHDWALHEPDVWRHKTTWFIIAWTRHLRTWNNMTDHCMNPTSEDMKQHDWPLHEPDIWRHKTTWLCS